MMIQKAILFTSELIKFNHRQILLCQQIRTLSLAKQQAVNSFTERSHNCGQLTKDDIGKKVNLFGWVQYSRFNNKIIALRDSYGTTQCVANKSHLTNSFKKMNITNESIIKVSGTVRARPQGQENNNHQTGQIEVLAENIYVVNSAKKDLPILTRDEFSSANLVNRLRHRYLDLRSRNMQNALRLRSKICKIFRSKLYELEFIECETPTLFKRTPGGANEYIVPTQISNKFYGLTQSPQQLKQLLMIGGLDRYFQICRCYRDESGRADRQPEFTQLDIELSFTNQDLVMKLIDELIYNLLEELSDELGLSDTLIQSFNSQKEITRITYKEAFTKYGTDKPDIRFGWVIGESEDDNLYIEIPHRITEEKVVDILEQIESDKNLDNSRHHIAVDSSKEEMTKLVVSGRSPAARTLLGTLRTYIANDLDQQNKPIYDCKFKFLWVTDFPLFTIDENGAIKSNHHPFTAPTEDSAHLLNVDPASVIGQHYDLVLNGQEIAGGSMRIHEPQVQERIFAEILKVKSDAFDYFVEALSSGCPPHGGIAIGLDRFVAILLGKTTIREVMAFPKSSTGRDLMSDCPQELDDQVKKLYHLK